MRRAVGVFIVLVLILAAAAGVWAWSRAPVTVPAAQPGVDEPARPALRESKWNAPIAARGQRTLAGVVLRGGAPVADAVVTALSVEGVPGLLEVKCACEDCPARGKEDLISPLCPDWEPKAAELVASRAGEGVPVGRTTTNAEGAFELQGLDDSVLSVWADAPDGVAFVRDVRSDARAVTLELKPGRALTGTIKRFDGQSVAGVTVTAVYDAERRAFEQVLGEDGKLRLGPVPDGKFVVGVLHGELMPEVLVVNSSTVGGIDLVLVRPRSVSGVVVDGAPVAGATVRLSGMRSERSTHTGPDGAFTFPRLRPGRYELEAESRDALGRVNVQLSASDELRDVTIDLLRGEAVSGVVVDERGAPVSGATVSLHTDAPPRQTTSDELGRFQFALVPSGDRLFAVERPGYLDAESTSQDPVVTLKLTHAATLSGRVESAPGVPVPEFRVMADVIEDPNDDRDLGLPGWSDAFVSTDGTFSLEVRPARYRLRIIAPRFPPLALEASAPQGELVITLKPGARLTGKVVDLDGQPAPNVDVVTLGEARSSTEVDSEGRFTLEGVAPGTVTVQAREVLDHGPGWVATKEVTLVAGQTTDVTLRPEAGVALAGVVLDFTGKPLPNVEVFAASMESARRNGHAVTDAAGRFSVRTVPAGRVNLTARLPPQRGYVNVTAPNEKVVVKMKRGTTLAGRVVDELGVPVKTFKVNLRGFDTLDGRFEVDVAEGTQVIAVDATGFALRNVRCEVKEGANELGDVRLSRGRALTGVVLDEVTRAPVAGALIDVKGAAEGDADAVSEAYGAVRTDAQGRYRLQRVDPSSTQLLASHPDYLFTSVPLASTASRQDLTMRPGGTVVARVLDAKGAVVPHARLVGNSEKDFEFFQPQSDGSLVGKGMPPGSWVLSLRNSDPRHTWRPRQLEVRAGSQTVELREAVDGVVVRVKLAGATGLALFPGDRQNVSDLDELVDEWQLIEVVDGVAHHVPAGKWTVLGVREGATASKLEITAQLIDVPASGEVVVDVVPRWRAVRGAPLFRSTEETPD